MRGNSHDCRETGKEKKVNISNNYVIYAFSSENEPAATVAPGSELVFKTFDCFCNQLRSESDRMEALDWDRINPATGPVFIEGAEVGDMLKVEIKAIDLNEKGTVVAGEGMGVLADCLQGVSTKIVPVDGDMANFTDDIKIPLRKMVGVIGVAPAEGAVNTGTPGMHGGNMDNTMVAPGATLYLPVNTPGALFGLGDVHAAMGDGEIGVSGLEIPAKVTVVTDLVKGKATKHPMLENDKKWSVIASAETLDEAAKEATLQMHEFLSKRMSMEPNEVAMLMSLAGNLEVCQVVDPLKTMRFVIDKAVVGEIGF